MNEQISVIIPVYKAEKYLGVCVDSVLAQSYSNLEIILVDDGSPDRCGAICDEYARRDPRVKVIHKENGGASSARNAGLKRASGKYLCFVDSDDALPPEGIAILYQAMSTQQAEYAAGICVIRSSGRPKNSIKKEQVIDLDTAPQEVLSYLTSAGSYSPYAKMFVTRIIRENRLSYNESLKCSEDALFIRMYVRFCKKLALVPTTVYLYNTGNESSLSKKGYEDFCQYFVEKLKALDALCDRMALRSAVKQGFLTGRAIHGLHISVNHYLKNWPQSDQQRCLVKKAMVLFRDWIDLKSPYTEGMEAPLRKWWAEMLPLYQEDRREEFYAAAQKAYRINTKQPTLKQLIKKLLGR